MVFAGGVKTTDLLRDVRFEDEKERVRENLDLVTTIAGLAGREFKLAGGDRQVCLCPFHSEKTPSFTVYESSQHFKCYGCGKAGDVFNFIMDHEGLGFRDALELAARRAGVTLTHFENRRRDLGTEIRLIDTLAAASRYFIENLATAPEHIRTYVHDTRGLSPETCEQWRIGYTSPEWHGLKEDLLRDGFTLEEMLAAGVIAKKRDAHIGSTYAEDYFDYFRDRVIFPIYNGRGQLVGFGGRALHPGEDTPKYMNSPDSPYFRKDRLLYGQQRLMADTKRDDAIIVAEGYTDVVSAAQAGINGVVATCGTAVTKRHAIWLARRSRDITFMMDGDRAGIAAGKKAAEVMFGAGIAPKLCLLPEGQDLDDVVRGADDSIAEVAALERLDVLGFHLAAHRLAHPTGAPSPDQKLEILQEVVGTLGAEPNPARRIVWTHDTAQRLDIPPIAVETTYFRQFDNVHRGPREAQDMRYVGTLFVAGLLASPWEYRRQFFDISPESPFFTPGIKALYEIIRAESTENGAQQLTLALKPRVSRQRDFVREEEVTDAFAYVGRLFEERELDTFPHEVVALFSRPLPRNVEVCADLLRRSEGYEARDRTIDAMFGAYCAGDMERVGTLRTELGELLQYG